VGISWEILQILFSIFSYKIRDNFSVLQKNKEKPKSLLFISYFFSLKFHLTKNELKRLAHEMFISVITQKYVVTKGIVYKH